MSAETIRGIATRIILRNLATTLRDKFKPKETIVVAGQERTAEWLANALDAAEPHFVRADQAKARFHQAVAERNAAIVAPVTLAKKTIASLEVHWGDDPTKLSDAGIPPRKQKRTLTAQEKFVAAEKAKQTRALRGTKGSRQKSKIKSGDIQVSTSSTNGATSTASSDGASKGGANVVVPSANGANPVVS